MSTTCSSTAAAVNSRKLPTTSDTNDSDVNFINNYNASSVTIDGGSGNDIIGNFNSGKAEINGGDGNDSILSEYSDDVSINAGAGDNSIAVYDSNNVKVATDNGNNFVDNIGKYSSIQTGSGEDAVFNVGSNVVIRAKMFSSLRGTEKITSRRTTLPTRLLRPATARITLKTRAPSTQ